MAWKKRGFGETFHYVIDDCDRVYHRTENITLEDLNDQERNFQMVHNPAFIVEYIEQEPVDKEELPHGLYRLECPDMYSDFKLVPWALPADTKLFRLDVVDEVLKDFDLFRSQKDIYNNLKMLYKRAALLYGPPGTGKTSAINMIIESLLTSDAIMIYVDNGLPTDALLELKKDPRLKIFIFEELTQTISKSNISRFLTFLDGEHSLDNCYIIATSNYPEQLPGNIIRQGRFNQLFKIDGVSPKDRKLYLEYYLKREITEEESTLTEEYNMASLKELILLVLKDKLTVKDAKKQLAKHQKTVKSNFKKSIQEIGFSDDD